MNRRVTMLASACAAAALVGGTWVQPAQAHWSFHDSRLADLVIAPPGGTDRQSCIHQLRAISGYAVNAPSVEEAAAVELPPLATASVSYQVWKGPRGSTLVKDEHNRIRAITSEGVRPAVLAGRVTTPSREPLSRPVPGNVGYFVVTTAPINVRLSGVAPGDTIGFRPRGNEYGVLNLTAMDCTLPVVPVTVDVVPGSRTNPVYPGDPDRLLPVRIFGNKRIDVRLVTRMRLGRAAPAPVPSELAASLRPRDVNGDGRLDRLYYVRQRDTDIWCRDRVVTVTGLTKDQVRFERKSPIEPVECLE